MATEDLTINIRERGSRTVSRAIDDIARSADRATKDLFLLVRAFRAVRDAAILLGGFGAVSEFIRQLDQITLYENRIRLVTSSFAELRTVYAELIETAVRSRSPLESIVELYARTALSAKELGVSQREVIQFTESVAKAATLSGATVREANASLIQLSQGVASNRLGGDELRSILEQLPFVADVIAKSLGVTRGELRELGSEGKITGEVVLKAFRDARVEIDTLFNNTVSTVGQALNVLGVRFLEAFGQLDDFLGLTETLSRVVLTLASNFDVLSGSVAALTAAFAVFFTLRYVTTIGTLITLVATLGGAFLTLAGIILSSPLATIAAVLTAAYIAARTFGNEIELVEGKLNSYGDVAQAVFEIGLEKAQAFGNWLGSMLPDIVNTVQRVFSNLGINIPVTFDELISAARNWANKTIGFFIGVSRALPKILESLPFAIGEVFVKVSNTVFKQVENMINGIITLIENGLKFILLPIANFLKENSGFGPGDIFGETFNGFVSSIENFTNLGRVSIGQFSESGVYGGKIADAIKESFTDELFSTDFIGAGVAEVLRRSDRIAVDREIKRIQSEADLTTSGTRTAKDLTDDAGGKGGKGGRSRKTFEDFIREVKGQNEALKVSSDLREKLLKVVEVEKSLRRELTREERELYLSLLETNQSLERQSEIFDSLRDPQRAYGILVKDLTALLEAGRISVDEFNDKLREGRIAMLELAETPLAGLERGFYQVTEAALDFSRFTEDAVTGTFSKLEDTIAEFVTTGKLNFRSFVTDVSAMLVKLATNQALQYLFNAAGSVLFPGFAPKTSGASGLNPSGGFLSPISAADGGTFEVSSRIGSPRAGRDNRFVPMYLRDGEMVEVTPKGQSPRRGGVTVNMTVYANDAGSFRASQDQIAADMGRKLSRAQRNE